MITNFLLTLGLNFSRLIINLFPEANLETSNIALAITNFLPVWNEWNNVLPLDTLTLLLGLGLAVETALLVFRVITWIRPPFIPIQPNF